MLDTLELRTITFWLVVNLKTQPSRRIALHSKLLSTTRGWCPSCPNLDTCSGHIVTDLVASVDKTTRLISHNFWRLMHYMFLLWKLRRKLKNRIQELKHRLVNVVWTELSLSLSLSLNRSFILVTEQLGWARRETIERGSKLRLQLRVQRRENIVIQSLQLQIWGPIDIVKLLIKNKVSKFTKQLYLLES